MRRTVRSRNDVTAMDWPSGENATHLGRWIGTIMVQFGPFAWDVRSQKHISGPYPTTARDPPSGENASAVANPGKSRNRSICHPIAEARSVTRPESLVVAICALVGDTANDTMRTPNSPRATHDGASFYTGSRIDSVIRVTKTTAIAPSSLTSRMVRLENIIMPRSSAPSQRRQRNDRQRIVIHRMCSLLASGRCRMVGNPSDSRAPGSDCPRLLTATSRQCSRHSPSEDLTVGGRYHHLWSRPCCLSL